MLCVLAVPTILAAVCAAPVDLRVSDNQRFLVRADGTPFFWLADTAWELFHRLSVDEAQEYLARRAAQGFTVIQAVALAELDGVGAPSAGGYLPLVNRDPSSPAVVHGLDNDYWDDVDAIVSAANRLGLVVAMLPTWGAWWHDGDTPLLHEGNAGVYGEWLGRRYAEAALVWVLGGDRPVETDSQRRTIEALVAGLQRGDGGRHLMTFHPRGQDSSANYFHDAAWLDFNMRQNGHGSDYPVYGRLREDYDRTPTKPVVDGEPVYEDHPLNFRPQDNGHSVAADTRRALYWDLFSGAFGHTYGHHSVWQMFAPGRQPVNGPLMPWYEAVKQPGAQQMRHARALLESRPFLGRVPDDTIIVPATPQTAVPGAGRYRLVATRDAEGSYAMVYTPVGRPFKVRMNVVNGPRVIAWWFDPRSGASARIGEYTNEGEQVFTSPDLGEVLDWVLVLDDAGRGFDAPGQRSLID